MKRRSRDSAFDDQVARAAPLAVDLVALRRADKKSCYATVLIGGNSALVAHLGW